MGPANERGATGRIRENPVVAGQQNRTGKQDICSGDKKKKAGESGNTETGELQHQNSREILGQVPKERDPVQTGNKNKDGQTGRENNGYKREATAASV